MGAPLCREKKTEKTAKRSFQPSWTEFLQCPYLQTGMRAPFFFALIAKSTSNSTQKCEKKFSHFLEPPHGKKKIFRPCHYQNHPNSGVFCIHLMNDAKRPSNALTYTQNDREKWQNTFTVIVSASLHVLVTENVQQASTITLAPRCSHASDSPGPAMVEFLSNPFLPCNLRPKYLKTGGVYPFFTTCSMRPEGGPLGQAAKPRSKGCGPLPLPRGQATLHFWAVGGAMLSLTPKNHI